MTNVFYDFEFIEGIKEGKHFIDLISVGMVKGNGEEYTAFSKEYEYEDANDWVKENVIAPLFKKADLATVNHITEKNFHKYSGKSKEDIAQEIIEFVGKDKIKLFGYYADYDHVLLSSLFGAMINLPSNFPMYTTDIQQIIDDHKIDKDELKKEVPQVGEHDALADAKWNKEAYTYIKKVIAAQKKK